MSTSVVELANELVLSLFANLKLDKDETKSF